MEYSVCTCRCTNESLTRVSSAERRSPAWGKTRPTYSFSSCLVTDRFGQIPGRRVAVVGVSQQEPDAEGSGREDADRDDQRGPEAVDVRRLAGIDCLVGEVLLDRLNGALEEVAVRRLRLRQRRAAADGVDDDRPVRHRDAEIHQPPGEAGDEQAVDDRAEDGDAEDS